MNTAALSPDLDAIARKSSAALLRAVARWGQAHIAAGLGVDESTVTRWKEGQKQFGALSLFDLIGRLLALLGLKVVPIDARCYRDNEIEAVFQLARSGMSRMESVRELEWEEGL